MADSLTLIQATGPLPLNAQFQAPSDGPAIFYVSGSAWSTKEKASITVQLLLDGVVVGTAGVYSNESGSHRALVPVMLSVQLPFGSHNVVLSTGTSNTATDGNDFFELVLLY